MAYHNLAGVPVSSLTKGSLGLEPQPNGLLVVTQGDLFTNAYVFRWQPRRDSFISFILARIANNSLYPLCWLWCTFRFTFLATLVLLILISFAIIVRSFVLRRRFRRRVEEALAAGAILPVPAPRGNRQRRDHRERPIIYDTWVKSGGEKWQYMMVRRMSPQDVIRSVTQLCSQWLLN